jgi:hypothetical protein
MDPVLPIPEKNINLVHGIYLKKAYLHCNELLWDT